MIKSIVKLINKKIKNKLHFFKVSKPQIDENKKNMSKTKSNKKKYDLIIPSLFKLRSDRYRLLLFDN